MQSHFRSWWSKWPRRIDVVPRHVVRFGLLTMLVGALCGAALWAQSSRDEPLAIQRIVLPPERIAKELEKVPQGGLVVLPLAEFDARLDRIRKKMQAREEKPRLIQAHYRAELIDRALQGGSGEWTIHHDGSVPAVLPIEPWNLAIASPRWKNRGDALLGEMDGKSLGLIVEPGAAQTFLFDWSARGNIAHEGITFQLATPACPITTFELTLPADHWLSAAKDAAISGPHLTTAPNKRLWNVQVTGGKPLEILARKFAIAPTKGPGVTLFARTHATAQLAPGFVEVEHTFQIDVLHGSVLDLFLDGDADLQPFEVTLKGGAIKTWTWNVTTKDANSKLPGELHLKFHHPTQGKLQDLRVRSLVARSIGSAWTSPGLRVRNALSRGEVLQMQIQQDFPQGKWDYGSFQMVDTSVGPSGKQIVTLAQAAPDTLSAHRPALLLPLKDVELRISEQFKWRLGPRGAELIADIDYAPVRGRLFEMTVKLPPAGAGYSIESLELQPAEQLRGWHLRGDFLVVELKQALAPPGKVSLKVRLTAPARELVSGNRFHSFPDIAPIGDGKRAGTLLVFVNPMLNSQLVGSTVPLSAAVDAAPDRHATANFRFDFRDQKPGATIRITPHPGLVTWNGQHQVTLAAAKARVQFRWEAEPIVGAPTVLDFRMTPGFPSAWSLKSEEGAIPIHHWERLHLHEVLPQLLHIGSQHDVHSAMLNTMLPAGSLWRFHLSEPLANKAHFTIEAEVPAGLTEEDARRLSFLMPQYDAFVWFGGALAAQALPRATSPRVWSIPLVAPAQTANVSQKINFESAREAIQKAEVSGHLVLRPATAKGPFHLELDHDNGPFTSASGLRLWTLQEKRAAALSERCDDAKVTMYVRKDGVVYTRVQFQLSNWRDAALTMRFPADVQIVAAKLHDRWLERLDVKTNATGVNLTLPFDQNAGVARYEIFTRTEPPARLLPGWVTLTTPSLDWPVPPLDVRTRICLEAGWKPMDADHLTRVGVPARIANQSATLRSLRHIWNWGQSWWPYGESEELSDRLDQQKQAVLLAEKQMRDAGLPKSMTLAAVLERFAVSHLKDTMPLVIDQMAIGSLGLSGETVLSAGDLHAQAARPFWEKHGLILVPCANGALLTSPRRMNDLGIQSPLRTMDLHEAMEEAILHGRDASAGFYLILPWLKRAGAESNGSAANFPIGDHLGDFQDMTEWLLTADAGALGSLLMIDSAAGHVLGWLLALLVALAIWQMNRHLSPVIVVRIILAALMIGMVLFVWLPGPVVEFLMLPALFTSFAGVLWSWVRLVGERRAAPSSGNSTVIKPTLTSAALGLVLLTIAFGAAAQTPADRAYPVYVIDGKTPTVLVTPDLLVKLDELETPPTPASRGAVLLGATYSGKAKGALTTFEAEFALHSFKDDADLVLPLASVQLEPGARLDDAPVFPTLHKNGFQIRVKKAGPHRLRLAFTARMNTVGEQADLSFTIPRLAQNEMSLDWPTAVFGIHCDHCLGAEQTDVDGGKSAKQWRGQLGYEKDVRIHWALQTGQPAPKAIDVKEAHFWDLRRASPALWTSFHYAVGKSSLSQCSVAVPEGLHVCRVDAVALAGTLAPSNGIVVKQWQMIGKGGQRRVQIDLAQPVSGSFLLNLELAPQSLAREKQFMPLPAPLQGKSISGLLGYRLDAVESRAPSVQNLSVQGVTPVEFEKLWKNHGGAPVPAASNAYSFQRKSLQAGLELVLQPAARQAQMQLVWNLDHHHADLAAKFTISSPRDDLMFLEFFVDPALTLSNITGPDVLRWHAQDSLAQVWLREPKKQTSVEISGWRSQVSKGKPPPKQTVALPGVYPLQAQLMDAALDVQPAPGLVDEPVTLRNLRPHPTIAGRYLIDSVPYEAAFLIRERPSPPRALILTKVQGSATSIEIHHSIRLTTTRGRLPVLRLHVKDGPGHALTVDAPGATIVPIKSKALGHPAWTLTYPPGQPQEVYVSIRSQIAGDKLGATILPSVELEGAIVEHAWLAWKNIELTNADTGKRQTNQKKVKDQIALIGNESWSRDLPNWSAAELVRPLKATRPRTPVSVNIRALTIAESAQWRDGHWLHGAALWLVVPEAAELRVEFPAAVESVRALTDQRSQAVWNSSAKEIVLPIEASALPQRMDLTWKYVGGEEPAEAPLLAPLVFVPKLQPATQRRILIPPHLVAPRTDAGNSATLFTRLLNDAETHRLLSEAIAQESTRPDDFAKRIAAAQQKFYSSVRQAEYALGALKGAVRDFDIQGGMARLNKVKDQNAESAKALRFDDQRKAAEKAKKFVPTTLARADTTPPGTPLVLPADRVSLALETAADRDNAARRTQSIWLLVIGGMLFLVSFLGPCISIARWFAPEMAIALGVAGLIFFGISLIGVLAIALVFMARLVWLGQKRLNQITPPANEPSVAGLGSTQTHHPDPPM